MTQEKENNQTRDTNEVSDMNYPPYLLKLREILTRSYEKDIIGLSQSLNAQGKVLYSIVKVLSSTKSMELALIDVRIIQAQDKRFHAFVKKLIHDLHQGVEKTGSNDTNMNTNQAEPCYYDLSNLEYFEQLMQPLSMNKSQIGVDELLSPAQFNRLYELCIYHEPINTNQMLQACLSLKEKVQNNAQWNTQQRNQMAHYYEQCFVDVFRKGVCYDLKMAKVLLRPSNFAIKLRKLGVSYDETRELLFEHLKNSQNLHQENKENKLSLCNTMLCHREDKKEFLRLIFKNEKGQTPSSIKDVPELVGLFEDNIALAQNPVVAIELGKMANVFKYEFSWEDDVATYLNYLLPTINAQAHELDIAEVILRDGKEKITLIVQSIDTNAAKTQLLIEVIETCLSLYKEKMKPNFPSLPDPDIFELKDLGFDIGRVILKVKLDNQVHGNSSGEYEENKGEFNSPKMKI